MSENNTLILLDQELIAGLPAAVLESYSAFSVAVLLLYDYFLTFPLELQYIWQGGVNIMKILFIVNRYSSLISLYSLIVTFFIQPAINIECRASYYTSEISSIFGALAINSIFTLRTYAIYGRSRTVFVLLAIPGFVNVASQIWSTSAQSAFALPLQLQFGPGGCISFSSSSNDAAELAGDISGTVFDALVVILTVCRTGRLAMQSRKLSISKSLSFVLFRDGALYYSAIFIPQFMLVVLDRVVLRSNNATLSNLDDALSNILNALQIVLINRLVLNLSHTANAREDSEFRTRTGLEPPTFATGPFLGNIGGPVRTLPDDMDDEAPEGNEDREITFVRDDSEYEAGGSNNNSQLCAEAEIEEISV